MSARICGTCGVSFVGSDPRFCPVCHAKAHNREGPFGENVSKTPEVIDWKAAYEAALKAHAPIVVDANRYRFLRDHTFVEAYWIDGSGGVDTKIRVQGCGEPLDLAVDMERIKEARSSYDASPSQGPPNREADAK